MGIGRFLANLLILIFRCEMLPIIILWRYVIDYLNSNKGISEEVGIYIRRWKKNHEIWPKRITFLNIGS